MGKNKSRWKKPFYEILYRTYQKCATENCNNSVKRRESYRPHLRKYWTPFCEYCKTEKVKTHDI